MERPYWADSVSRELTSEDARTFYQADVAAKDLGIDTWGVHFKRVQAAPLKSHSWYRLLEQTDQGRIDEVLSYAASVLPLDRIAMGPSDTLGFGTKYAAHSALDWILQALRRFPERGWEFMNAGLQSTVTRNRNMALTALLAWPRASWPEGAEWLLGKASVKEPNEALKERLKQALGRP